MSPALLGEVTCPSGQLVVVDGGYLRLWCGTRSPADLDPELLGVNDPEDVRGAGDFEIVGPDAEAAARSFDRQEGVWLYDIPASGIAKVIASFDEHCREHGFAAQIQRTDRVPHRTRVKRCAPGSFVMFGVPVVAIAGVPTDRALPVYAVKDGDQAQAVIHVSDAEVVSRQRIGAIFVDWARYAIADADALNQWQHDEPIDGRADVAFWGRDQERAAAATGAFRVDNGYGWSDVDVEDAVERLRQLTSWQEAHPDQKIAVDYRPHSHHWRVMREVRSSPTDSGTTEVAGAQVLFAMTPHGDGWYAVFAEYGRAGELATIRLILG